MNRNDWIIYLANLMNDYDYMEDGRRNNDAINTCIAAMNIVDGNTDEALDFIHKAALSHKEWSDFFVQELMMFCNRDPSYDSWNELCFGRFDPSDHRTAPNARIVYAKSYYDNGVSEDKLVK